MNPILASSIANLGCNIIQRVIPTPSKNSNQTNSVDFATNLERLENAELSGADLEILKSDLLNSPEIQDFLTRNHGNKISIDQLADGSIRFLSSSGDFLSLSSENSCHSKASEFFQQSLRAGVNLDTSRVSTVVILSG